MQKKIALWAFCALAAFGVARGKELVAASTPALAVSQSPTVTISSSNLSGAAGTDLSSTANSSSMILGLTISNGTYTNKGTTYATPWTAYFSLGSASSNWPSNLSCNIQLLSAGSSNATSTTSGSYLTLTSTGQSVFSGSGNGSGITLQCQLSNLSLANCPPTTSTATLPIVCALQSS